MMGGTTIATASRAIACSRSSCRARWGKRTTAAGAGRSGDCPTVATRFVVTALKVMRAFSVIGVAANATGLRPRPA